MYAAPELSTEDGTPNENVDVKYVQAVDVFGAGLVAVDCVLGTIPKEEQIEHLAFRESRKTAVVVNEENAGDADERRRVAQLLTSHGLVAITVNLGSDIATTSASADSEQDIPGAVSDLVQELVRSKRI